MAAAVTTRTARADDADFAYTVIERTMKGYAIATWGKWLEGEAREQTRLDAINGRSRVIEVDGQAVGLLRSDAEESHIQLDQLFVLPEFQRRGVGAVVLQAVLAQARLAGIPVRLRVLRVNPAIRFYARHGFRVVSESPERFYMESAV
jgi:GNAT superfamily N-acetyltransferase